MTVLYNTSLLTESYTLKLQITDVLALYTPILFLQYLISSGSIMSKSTLMILSNSAYIWN